MGLRQGEWQGGQLVDGGAASDGQHQTDRTSFVDSVRTDAEGNFIQSAPCPHAAARVVLFCSHSHLPCSQHQQLVAPYAVIWVAGQTCNRIRCGLSQPTKFSLMVGISYGHYEVAGYVGRMLLERPEKVPSMINNGQSILLSLLETVCRK